MAVFSSTMTRSVQTAVGVGKGAAQYVKWKALDEIDVGICDGKDFFFLFSRIFKFFSGTLLLEISHIIIQRNDLQRRQGVHARRICGSSKG